MAAAVERPLKELADAFHNLSLTVATPNSPPMTIEAFLGACSKMPAIITAAFDASYYLMDEFVEKIFLLLETNSGSFDLLERELIQLEELRNKVPNQATTLAELIDQDMANNSVRIDGSNCRLILRMWRAIEFMKVMFQELLNGRDVSLQTAALNAYKSVFGRYDDMNVMGVALISIMELPTRAEIQDKINETEGDEIIQMKRYVDGSSVVIEDVGKLFETRKLPTDW